MSNKIDRICSYERLARWRDMFMSDDGIELIVVGPPGRGKSRMFTDAMGRPDIDYALFRGHATAFQMYRKLFACRDLPVLIDDVHDALREKDKRSLLMSLTENEQLKTICWESSSGRLVTEEGDAIPTRFQTRSRTCVLTNHLGEIDKYMAPLISRAFVIEFCPSKDEIHRYAARWFDDVEIHDFVGQHLPVIADLDLRDYGQALTLKRHGEDWKQMLLNRWTDNSKLSVVMQVIADPTLATFEQRVDQFHRQTGASRRTFAYLLAKLRRLGAVSDGKVVAPLHEQVQEVFAGEARQDAVMCQRDVLATPTTDPASDSSDRPTALFGASSGETVC